MSHKWILDHRQLAAQVAELKRAGKRIVFTNGAFDVLHVGHLRSLADARRRGDVLLVAINSDRSVRERKGPGRPIVPQEERLEMLAALDCVDLVTVFEEATVDGLLRQLQPHVHAKGTDYTRENVPERETVLSYGGEIAIVGDPKDHSSTALLERIAQNTAPFGSRHCFLPTGMEPQDFCLRVEGSRKWVIARRYLPRLAEMSLHSFDEVMRYAGGTCLSRRPSRDILRLAGNPPLYLKRYHRSRLSPLRAWWCLGHPLSTAGNEWRNYLTLANLGFSIPELVAWGEEISWGLERRSFILTAEVPGIPLHTYLTEMQLRGPEEAHRLVDELIPLMAVMLRRLHWAGLHYPDFVSKHLYIQNSGVSLIDVQRLQRVSWGRGRAQIKDLAAFNLSVPRAMVTTTERLRFLRHYLGIERLSETHGSWVRKILRRSHYLSRTRKGYREFFAQSQ